MNEGKGYGRLIDAGNLFVLNGKVIGVLIDKSDTEQQSDKLIKTYTDFYKEDIRYESSYAAVSLWSRKGNDLVEGDTTVFDLNDKKNKWEIIEYGEFKTKGYRF